MAWMFRLVVVIAVVEACLIGKETLDLEDRTSHYLSMLHQTRLTVTVEWNWGSQFNTTNNVGPPNLAIHPTSWTKPNVLGIESQQIIAFSNFQI